LAAATTLFALSFDSLWGNIRWGFHENAIAFFCTSWAMALLFVRERDTNEILRWVRRLAVLLLLLVSAGSKEILLLDIGLVLLCWAFLELKEKSFFSVVLAVLAFALFTKFVHFERLPHPADKNYFDRYYSYLGHNLKEFFQTLFGSPERIIEVIGARELFKYFRTVFLPWLFLPFLTAGLIWFRRRTVTKEFAKIGYLPWIIALIPSFASAALATFPPLRRANFHYVLELWPILAPLTVLTLAMFRSPYLIWGWALFSMVQMDHDPIADFREYRQEAIKMEWVRNKIQELPIEASVVAEDLAGTWIAGRKNVTRWPETVILPNQCPEFIIVRRSESGTLSELGVRSIMTRCESKRKEPKINSDLVVPTPMWRNSGWALYQVKIVK
jgi:hypothetical protein